MADDVGKNDENNDEKNPDDDNGENAEEDVNQEDELFKEKKLISQMEKKIESIT